jgi:multidrug efflux system membrane fusion protein
MKSKLILILIALVIASCAKKPMDQPPQGVQVMPVQSTDQSTGLRFSGSITPDQQVVLSFRIPGYVTSIMQIRGEDGNLRAIDAGDRINRPSEYQEKTSQAKSEVEAAEAIAVKAKLDYDRATRLYQADSITKADFDAIVAQYNATQAQVKAARAQTGEAQIALNDTTLIAPFSGEIVNKSVEIGAFVGPTLPAFAMTNTDSVKILIGVPDLIVRSLKVLQPVDVSIDAFPNRKFNARITRISSAADPRTRNFEVEVSLPNPDHSLKVGMIGSLQLFGDSKKHRSSILVPLSSIVQAGEGKYGVFLLDDSKAGKVTRLRSVEVGNVEGSDIQVTSGLSQGDMVITTGATLLKDGERVEVLQ